MEERFAIEIATVPEGRRERGALERAVALDVGAPLDAARRLLARSPTRHPRVYASEEAAREAAARLAELGAVTSVVQTGRNPHCSAHPSFDGSHRCADCKAPLCTLCAARSEPPRCPACHPRFLKKRRFYRVRVGVLLAVLGAVLLYAWRDVRSRSLRTDWTRTLRVVLVVVPTEAVDVEMVEALRGRIGVLERRLTEEMQRHGRAGDPPFSFTLAIAPEGAVTGAPAPPAESDDLIAAARYAWELHRFTTAADDGAAIDGSIYDARVYLVTRVARGTVRQVEGVGEKGGRIGVVEIDLDRDMVDLALFVAAHELFHVLGASDKYDASGEVMVPEGLADPSLEPLYPQRDTELMARERLVAPGRAVLPDDLSELRIGESTAREIGWR